MVRTFIQLTDTHITPRESDRFFGRDTMHALRDAFAWLHMQNLIPAYPVLISGDLANNGERASYERLRAVVEAERAAGVDVSLLLGNHDNRAMFREVMLGEPANDGQAPYYQRRMLDGLRLLLLDTHLPGTHAGALGAAQLAWLADELAAPTPEGTILVLHHPPAFTSHTTQLRETIGDAEALHDLIARSDVIGILSGHVHVHSTGAFAGKPSVTAPGTAFLVDPFARGGIRFLDGGGFHVVTVADREMIVRPVALPGTQGELAFLTPEQLRIPGRVPGTLPAATVTTD